MHEAQNKSQPPWKQYSIAKTSSLSCWGPIGMKQDFPIFLQLFFLDKRWDTLGDVRVDGHVLIHHGVFVEQWYLVCLDEIFHISDKERLILLQYLKFIFLDILPSSVKDLPREQKPFLVRLIQILLGTISKLLKLLLIGMYQLLQLTIFLLKYLQLQIVITILLEILSWRINTTLIANMIIVYLL